MTLSNDFYTSNLKVYNKNDLSMTYLTPVVQGISATYEFCENYAFMNMSPFFILSDGSNNSNNYINQCYIYNSNSIKSTPQDAYNWLESLTPATCSTTQTCSTMSGDDIIYPLSNYFSVYESPLANTSSTQDNYIQLDPNYVNDFNSTYSKIIQDLSSLELYYTDYMTIWYQDVSLNSQNNIIYNNNTAENIYSGEDQFYAAANKLMNNFYYLNSLLVNLELNLKKNNNNYTRNSDYIKIINNKILVASREFNRIMSEKTGALGMLENNKYNTNLIITENIVLFFTILILLFVYFKYINN